MLQSYIASPLLATMGHTGPETYCSSILNPNSSIIHCFNATQLSKSLASTVIRQDQEHVKEPLMPTGAGQRDPREHEYLIRVTMEQNVSHSR